MELPRPPGLYFVFKTSQAAHETQEPIWAHSSCTCRQQRRILKSDINESLPLLPVAKHITVPPNARSELTYSFQPMPPARLITYNCAGSVTSLMNGCSDKHCML